MEQTHQNNKIRFQNKKIKAQQQQIDEQSKRIAEWIAQQKDPKHNQE